MQKIARTHHQSAHLHWHARAHNPETRVTGHRAARKIVHPQSTDLGNVTDCAVRQQPDRAQACQESRHHLPTVRGKVRVRADLLKRHHHRFGRLLDGPPEFSKPLAVERLTRGYRFHLRRYRVAHHSPKLREHTADLKRRESLVVRPHL